MYTDVTDIGDAVMDAIEQLDESVPDSECCGGLHTEYNDLESIETAEADSHWADELDNDWNELADDGTVPDAEYESLVGEMAHRLIPFAESILHPDSLTTETLSAPADLWREMVSRVGIQAEFAESTGAIYRSVPTPSLVFEVFGSDRYPALRQQFEQWFEVVGLPRMPLSQPLQSGDLLLRRIGEANLTHSALLVSGEALHTDELAYSGWNAEGVGSGYYAQVVEAGAVPHCTHHSFARRITDATGYLPYDQMILRFKSSVVEAAFFGEAEDERFQETTPTVSVVVRNRIINHETVAGCDIELVDTTARGTTNRGGRVTLDLTGVADGTYSLRAIHPFSTTAAVGPDIASTTPRPDRIWRPFETPITIVGSRVIATSSPDAVLASGRLTLKMQPIWMASPNRSARTQDITLCVVHHTGGTIASSAINTFLAPRSTSAHYVIDTDGQIIKMVHELEQAFHAGHSHWLGRDSVNGFSVGIEIVNRSNPYTPAQMAAVVDLLNRIRAAYPGIPANQIVGHSDIATNKPGSPNRKLGRKSGDPGSHFDWATLEGAGLGMTVIAAPPTPGQYGGFFDTFPTERLRRGDNDTGQVFGGRHRPTITAPVIAELQTDLSRIGYFCPITGRFDDPTVAGVKMFEEHFFSGTRRRTDPAFRSGQVDSVTAMAIKNVR
jgi:N-acetylmuramoyl-L-alanine amidase